MERGQVSLYSRSKAAAVPRIHSQVPPAMGNGQRTRSLPQPPTSLPAYEPPAPSPVSPKSPVDSVSTVAFVPPKPSPPYVENPPVQLSAAQQLYSTSLVNRGPPIPTLPPPLFETHRRSGLEPPSFYKNQVSSYAPHSTSGATLPDSNFSSTPSSTCTRSISSPTYVRSVEPRSPTYASFSDGRQSTMSTTRDSRLPHNSGTYVRDRAEQDDHTLTPIAVGMPSHVNFGWAPAYSAPQETRNLFPLTYVDKARAREIRTVTTTMKPPPNFETSHSITPNVVAPPHASATASLSPSLSSQTSGRTHSLPVIVSPPPPSLNVPQQLLQQHFIAPPPPPQSYVQPNVSLHLPQTISANGSAESNKNRTARLMNGISSLASSLGHLAVRSSAQSLLSGSSIEEGAEEVEEGGSSGEMGLAEFLNLDVTDLASASSASVGFDNGSSARSAVMVPAPQFGAQYLRNPSVPLSMVPPRPLTANGNMQYTSHDTNAYNTMNAVNTWATNYTHTRQTHLPVGALQPYSQSSQPAVYKSSSPGWSPY